MPAQAIPTRALICGAFLCAGAPQVAADPLLAMSGDCSSVLMRGAGTRVDIAWVAREHDRLRGYRLTVVEQAPGLAPSQCVLDVAALWDARGLHQPRPYRLTLSASPDAAFSVSLSALPDVGLPLFLAERRIVASPRRLRQDRPAPQDAPAVAVSCSAAPKRAMPALPASVDAPALVVFVRPVLVDSPATAPRAHATRGPRGPPITAVTRQA